MAASSAQASSRLRHAAFTPIGDEGRAELVASRLIQAITTGAFVQGERLPSETELAELLGVAIITVREALANLRMRGWIATRRGRHGGSFVQPSYGEVLELNARSLAQMPRIELADLGVQYQVIASACGVYACRRATPHELDALLEVLHRVGQAETPQAWRRQVTDAQLELAALSQSVRLTNDHIRVHTECIPYFSLQDDDDARRAENHQLLVDKVHAIADGDEARVERIVEEDTRKSLRWLMEYRATLHDTHTERSAVPSLR